MSKTTYKAWAGNDQGASTDVARGERFSSAAKAAKAARAEFGGGWTIHIVAHYGEEAEFAQREVKQFRIRH